MAYEAKSGIKVHNQYGPRDTGTTVGVERTTDSLNKFSVELTGKSLADGTFISSFTIPKNAKFLRAWVTCDEAFGAAPTAVSIGEGENPATNGITIGTAELNTVGVKESASKLTGTWVVGSNTARASRIAMVVTGDADPTKGLATVTIEYLYKTRDDSNWKPAAATMPTLP